MDKQAILAALTPQIVDKFRRAIEIGKWENGDKLSDEQRQTCMQAVMVWEHEYLPQDERTGYIHKPIKEDKTVVGEACDIEHEHHYPHNQSHNQSPHNQAEFVKFKS